MATQHEFDVLAGIGYRLLSADTFLDCETLSGGMHEYVIHGERSSQLQR